MQQHLVSTLLPQPHPVGVGTSGDWYAWSVLQILQKDVLKIFLHLSLGDTIFSRLDVIASSFRPELMSVIAGGWSISTRHLETKRMYASYVRKDVGVCLVLYYTLIELPGLFVQSHQFTVRCSCQCVLRPTSYLSLPVRWCVCSATHRSHSPCLKLKMVPLLRSAIICISVLPKLSHLTDYAIFSGLF